MSVITTGDRVRIKATGEIMVVEGRTNDGDSLLLSKWGQMAGTVMPNHEVIPVAVKDVVKVTMSVEWLDADE
jgi:hypothetical protein